MNRPKVSIIIRSFNEAWALKDTLAMLRRQRFSDWELLVIDSGSEDGSQDLIRAAKPAHFVQIAPKDYNPGRVMNMGMRLATADLAVFLNADATPHNDGWLAPLVAALADPMHAACFGAQVPRGDCRAVFAADYARCFGPNRESANWPHFFSMVSSGLRRDVWALRGFREDIRWAEDDEYTRWCKAKGYSVVYVPESSVIHSHNYTLAQVRKRCYGEAVTLGLSAGHASPVSWVRTFAGGLVRDVFYDLRFVAQSRSWRDLPHAIAVRCCQRSAKLAGLRAVQSGSAAPDVHVDVPCAHPDVRFIGTSGTTNVEWCTTCGAYRLTRVLPQVISSAWTLPKS